MLRNRHIERQIYTVIDRSGDRQRERDTVDRERERVEEKKYRKRDTLYTHYSIQ